MRHTIYLAEACQNTFIIVDCLQSSSLDSEDVDYIHAALLESKRDDALILINSYKMNSSLSIEMRVLGVDKRFADFCGNGSRACAAYLYAHYPQYKQFFIRAKKKNHLLTHHGENEYSTELPPVNFHPDPKFIAKEDAFQKDDEGYFMYFYHKKFYYTDIMEPHLILNERLSLEETYKFGARLNQEKALFPAGINLTVFHYGLSMQHLFAVTFERGIQNLSQSCGSGACCAGAFYLKEKVGQIKVKNPGGLLTIFNYKNGITLKGPSIITGLYQQPVRENIRLDLASSLYIA
ncbi:diaminopimelate epimerase (plasmid) [Legionella adelaidensis]|uniref:Diaminopimelate epimerase n=1 Tax=Legionella adelaidensis TaxID=45056 RepID=A0A0W0R149_9GAMM|nr:hypothetical protein [Legionella adelaidensis]KTC64746.1 Diaminopimelate epimerase [Legionella adelaidensis]VEH81294.1 diaminopimelate epimerase [Legionella adelaidensis]